MPNTKRPCGCDCRGCLANMDEHCLNGFCSRIRNRRTLTQLEGAGRYSSGRARRKPEWAAGVGPSKVRVGMTTPVQPTEKFLVTATRNGKRVQLVERTRDAAERCAAAFRLHNWETTVE